MSVYLALVYTSKVIYLFYTTYSTKYTAYLWTASCKLRQLLENRRENSGSDLGNNYSVVYSLVYYLFCELNTTSTFR